jgi:hypothetical protein
MFRASQARPRRSLHLPSLSTAAAAMAVSVAALTGGAYAAVLPGPIQHLAHRVLSHIGVPDIKHSAAPQALPSPPRKHAHASPSAVPRKAPSLSPRPPALVLLSAAHSQIPSGGTDTLFAHLPPGARVRLLARQNQGWYQAGMAKADRDGLVSFTVRHLTRNISFRLASPLTSDLVLVTVVPRLTVTLAPSSLPGTESLVAYARYADPGDLALLQIRVHGLWQDIAEQQLGADDRTTFTVAAGEDQDYRIVLLSTASHASAASPQVKPDIRTKRVLRRAEPASTPG